MEIKLLFSISWLRISRYAIVLSIAEIFVLPIDATALTSKTALSSIQVLGTITDEDGASMPGVNVIEKGTANGTTTDVNGKYILNVQDEKAVLVFSFIGYEKQEVTVGNQSTIDLVMVPDVSTLAEVVVTGYGTQRKVDLTGAVATVKADALNNYPTTSLSNSLAGRLSGVFVVQSTGVPGVSSAVRIRSGGSWNSTPVLYVIDGIIRDKSDFDRLDPSEVDNVTVLKDAASAAIYGSRAAGGVILVTTKRGGKGKPVINYNGSFSFDNPTSEMELMDPFTEGIPWMNRIFPDPNDPSYGWAHWSEADIQGLKDFGGWHSPLDQVYRTPTVNRHTINVSGGSENVKYFIGSAYAKQNGFLPNLYYDKYTLRANVEANITKNLTASLRISSNYDKKSTYNWGGDFDGNGYKKDDLPNLYGWLFAAYGNIPTYIDGNKPVDNGWSANLVERIKSGYDRTSAQNLDALASLAYDVPFVKGLSLKAIFSQNNNYGFNKKYDINHLMYTLKPIEGSAWRILSNEIIGTRWSNDPGTEYLRNSWSRSSSYQLNGQISYNRDFDKHHFDAFFVYEQSEWKYNDLSGTRKSFPVVKTDQFWATSSDAQNYDVGGAETFGARLSYVGKINYSYADKYLLSASVRRDGSLGFSPDKRWGLFPAVSAGWRISEESFLKDNVDFIDDLKLRASYGLTGNDNVGGWQWQDQYYVNQTYILGGQPVRGINIGGFTNNRYYNVANPNLTWEKSRSYNFGIDAQLLNAFSFSFEYWTRHTTDILGGRIASYPVESGIRPSDENYGIVDSHGLEVELGFDGQVGRDFKYAIRGSFSYATNKVVNADVAENAQAVDDPNGKTLGYIRGLRNIGLIRTPADLARLPAGYTINGYAPELGMINFEDVSGPAGTPDGKIDSYDRVVISRYSLPPYALGLNLNGTWKGVTLDIFFQGNLGHHKLFNDDLNGRMADPWDMPFRFWLDSWTPENPTGKYPMQREMWGGVTPSNVQDSDFWLMDASYVRLKQATLGYSIPSRIPKRIGLERVHFSLTGTNLFTWSKMKLYDPELNSYSAYPIMRTTTIAINITL